MMILQDLNLEKLTFIECYSMPKRIWQYLSNARALSIYVEPLKTSLIDLDDQYFLKGLRKMSKTRDSIILEDDFNTFGDGI